jgi:SPP1 family predicted phage head-tail adaptor
VAKYGPREPGHRDKRVLIQQVADSAGDSNYPVETWTTLRSVWAKREDLRGMERLAAMQVSAKHDTRWELPFSADMDPELVNLPKKRRLVYGGRTYDIVSASQIGRREGVEVMTIAKVG